MVDERGWLQVPLYNKVDHLDQHNCGIPYQKIVNARITKYECECECTTHSIVVQILNAASQRLSRYLATYICIIHCLCTFQLHFDELFEAIRNPERLHAYIQFISNFFHSYISVLPIPLRCWVPHIYSYKIVGDLILALRSCTWALNDLVPWFSSLVCCNNKRLRVRTPYKVK